MIDSAVAFAAGRAPSQRSDLLRELVGLCLRRSEELDPELNSFTVVRRQRALAEAEAADGRRGETSQTVARRAAGSGAYDPSPSVRRQVATR